MRESSMKLNQGRAEKKRKITSRIIAIIVMKNILRIDFVRDEVKVVRKVFNDLMKKFFLLYLFNE